MVPETRNQLIKIIDVGGGITRIVLFFGFMERPDLMEGLQLACAKAHMPDVDPHDVSYYFRRETLIPANGNGAIPNSSLSRNMTPAIGWSYRLDRRRLLPSEFCWELSDEVPGTLTVTLAFRGGDNEGRGWVLSRLHHRRPAERNEGLRDTRRA